MQRIRSPRVVASFLVVATLVLTAANAFREDPLHRAYVDAEKWIALRETLPNELERLSDLP